MPLGRKHLRRSRDAPTSGMGLQRTTSILRRKCREVKCRWASLHHTFRVTGTLPLLWTRMRLWTWIRSAIHNSDGCRNGLRGIGLCGCGYGHVIAARNRIRGQITDGNSAGCPSRGKRAARSDGSAGETHPAIHGIVGDGRGDTSVRASIERSRRNKALAKRNRNRGRSGALTTAGDQYRCHRYADDSFDNQWDTRSAKGHEMASTQLATRRV
jgi:hypothetical protein